MGRINMHDRQTDCSSSRRFLKEWKWPSCDSWPKFAPCSFSIWSLPPESNRKFMLPLSSSPHCPWSCFSHVSILTCICCVYFFPLISIVILYRLSRRGCSSVFSQHNIDAMCLLILLQSCRLHTLLYDCICLLYSSLKEHAYISISCYQAFSLHFIFEIFRILYLRLNFSSFMWLFIPIL